MEGRLWYRQHITTFNNVDETITQERSLDGEFKIKGQNPQRNDKSESSSKKGGVEETSLCSLLLKNYNWHIKMTAVDALSTLGARDSSNTI